MEEKDFNIGYYFLMAVKKFLNSFNLNVNWTKTQRFIDFGEEINSQLDITYIIKRLMFFDVAISKLMEKHEI